MEELEPSESQSFICYPPEATTEHDNNTFSLSLIHDVCSSIQFIAEQLLSLSHYIISTYHPLLRERMKTAESLEPNSREIQIQDINHGEDAHHAQLPLIKLQH